MQRPCIRGEKRGFGNAWQWYHDQWRNTKLQAPIASEVLWENKIFTPIIHKRHILLHVSWPGMNIAWTSCSELENSMSFNPQNSNSA